MTSDSNQLGRITRGPAFAQPVNTVYLISPRRLLAAASAAGVVFSTAARGQWLVEPPLPGGPGARQITIAFPQKIFAPPRVSNCGKDQGSGKFSCLA
jgi:hypothetical protein